MSFRTLQLWIIRLSAFWGTTVQHYLQRNPGRRNIVIVCMFVTVAYFAVWRSNNWYAVYRILPEERGWLPAMEHETLPCQGLIDVAKLILDGEPIPLPFSKGKTMWRFKDRVSTELILENLVSGKSDNDIETFRKRKLYNVTSSSIKAQKMFVTFGHNCCSYSKQRALKHAKEVGGFDYVRSFNLDSLSAKFRETHKDMLKERRGAGYWLWKPYILLKTMIENMNKGDLVMYQDAGAYLIKSAGPLLKLGEQSKYGVVVFTLNKIERAYTKQDAMTLMNMSIPEAADTFQRLASFVVLRKSCAALQFTMEWLAYLSDRRIATDDANTLGVDNHKSFWDHRHDQSTLSLLSKKWGVIAYRDPSQYGETVPTSSYYSSGPYDQIFKHDRFKW